MRAPLSLLVSALALAACSGQSGGGAENNIHGLGTVRYELDSKAGRGLFVDKGCVICHSINGVGGKAAPPLDAQIGAPPVDPLDFSSRMWRGAPAMIELQSVELGYTIYLTAQEIANLAAFAADREEQKKLVLDDVSEAVRNSFLDEQFWEVEDWTEFMRGGREGYEPPVDDGAESKEPKTPEEQ